MGWGSGKGAGLVGQLQYFITAHEAPLFSFLCCVLCSQRIFFQTLFLPLHKADEKMKTKSRGYKIVFRLNSAEHEILIAHK